MGSSYRKEDVMMCLMYRKSDSYGIAGAALICYLLFIMVAFPGLCAATTSSPAQSTLSTEEKEQLVQQGVTYYEKKKLEKAREILEEARSVFPENYAVPYYLGLIHLEQGSQADAIDQWREYVKLDPKGENAQMIRKNITILLREQAQAYAIQAVSDESALLGEQGDENTIAVTTFTNMGSDYLGPLGKGVASMLIADLSQVPDLRVVDRIKLQALLKEMALGTSGLVDKKTAPRVGKMLKARHVTSGTLADIEADNLMIASAVVDADKNANVGAQEAKGGLKKFYEMEKQIACQILRDLDRDCKTAPPAFNKIHTKSMPALMMYSEGLDQFDKGSYDAAREMFQKSLKHDPKFDLAIAALLATPPTAMASMDKSQMISSASSSGPPSATAGTAVAGSTVTTVASSAIGISPTTAIASGVAVVGGGIALAGGGGGDGKDPGPVPAATLSLSGNWRGTWDAQGEATFSMTQSEDNVNGTVTLTGDACMTTGNISGNVAGNTANLVIDSGAERVTLDATIRSSSKTMSGTLNYTASGIIACAGKSGNFSVTLITGGADIDW